MQDPRYVSLLEDFCRLCNAKEKDVAAIKETGIVSLDGVAFTLVPFGEMNLATLFIVCELGPLGGADENQTYKRMLEINFYLIYQYGPQMAISPENGRPLLITRVPLEDVNAKSLLEGLRGSVQLAKQWQSGKLTINSTAFRNMQAAEALGEM